MEQITALHWNTSLSANQQIAQLKNSSAEWHFIFLSASARESFLKIQNIVGTATPDDTRFCSYQPYMRPAIPVPVRGLRPVSGFGGYQEDSISRFIKE
jgi:hypothetical protein